MERVINVPLVFAVWRRHARVWVRTWYTNILPSILEPLLYLVGFGLGVGAFIESMEGHTYTEYIAPGIIAATIMFGAFVETTWAAFVRMYFQRTWQAIAATPASASDVLVGELTWGVTKSLINSTLMFASILIMSLVLGNGWILDPRTIFVVWPLAVVGGFLFGGLGLMITAYAKTIDMLNIPFFLLINPMFILAGVFFPLSQLPTALQSLAMALPLTHVGILMRAGAWGEFAPQHWWSVAYLVVGAFVLSAAGVRLCLRRIVS